jgi:hypothetical protein
MFELLQLICDLFRYGFFLLLGLGALYAVIYVIFIEDIVDIEPLTEYYEPLNNKNDGNTKH